MRVGCRVVVAARKIDDGFGWYCMVLVWWVVVRYVGLVTVVVTVYFILWLCLSVCLSVSYFILHQSL